MKLEEIVEWIKQQAPLNKDEVRYLFIKFSTKEKEEKTAIKEQLLKHYLPLTLEYLKTYQETFPERFQTEEDYFDIWEEGYFFLDSALHCYAYGDGYNFKQFYQKQLKKEMRRLQLEKEQEKTILESLDHSDISEEIDPLDEFSVLCDQLYQAMEILSPMEQRVVINFYHLSDHLPQQLLEDAKKLHLSSKKQGYARETGVKQLRKRLNNEDNKTTYYQHNNRLKVIK